MLSTWMMAVAASALTAGQQTAPQWHDDYGQALAETKQEAQPLLVVLDDPSNEAKRLDPALLSAETGGLSLGSYALCRVDVTTDYGKKVAEGFKVTEFPHVAIIDKSGSVILRRIKGDVSLAEWKSVLNRHQNGVRTGATRYTVAKPVVSEAPAVMPTFSSPVYNAPVYSSPQPYCPSCQRNR